MGQPGPVLCAFCCPECCSECLNVVTLVVYGSKLMSMMLGESAANYLNMPHIYAMLVGKGALSLSGTMNCDALDKKMIVFAQMSKLFNECVAGYYTFYT